MAEMIVKERGTESGPRPPGDAPIRLGLVDDDRMLLAALGQLLADLPGFQLVGTASTVDQGLALVGTGALDVIIVDVRMPGGGGELVASGARLLAPHTAVIALSASKDEASREAMARAGAVAYLVKDTSIARLLAAIEDAAARYATVGAPGRLSRPA